MKRIFLASVLAIFSAGIVASSAAAESTLERIKRTGVVQIGFSNEKPYSFKQPDGSLAGVDYELARAAFAKLGVHTVDGVAVKFSTLIPGLKAGHFDAIAAGLFIRPDRCAEIAFAEPHIQIADAITVQKGNPKNIHSYDDVLKNPTIKIGTQQGSASRKDFERLGIPESQLVVFQDFPEVFFALKSGRVDLTTSTIFAANESIAADGGKSVERATPFILPVFDGKPSINYLGFGFRKDDQDLVAAFNDALRAFRSTPDYEAILAKYSVTPADVPSPDVKLVDICKE
ncbi:ectoine/hydroxyectoine ABC transporter substrate-binding protein EhuB [Agrobacterium rhizogenes]|uniref:Ectoine/hydroxyectoine ABC transporter solute-binding protein n=1 Tax=Rhizobium rhizogenes (strain K84 / ATCC BAA-868) TaxID=311403 RepID=B9JQK8_RHIR8|nr:ectoine/hydroxyectoine ABC transporter solute-binding protein [Rhizobium rhizogenes K84]NTI53059.1 ectoine/hydroxyectoine ABC transporter substrate-binding protein EhuB [Rhizobium rhizogenes]NTI98432.1 ectoine/hydroxyectoine ABC transporter substrate-binding protein EhuB [Rhizobium rhizogenes]NTJ60860.1 ectoine/hydroxyectoine ABC transporter substrate-binding protein EhuB [Rhizobium rhizogenes]OCJ28556.1 ectoine/hydroxyectoine ABC transporter substrate-binding protein EhuB [Agrobacterium sp.